MPGAFGSGGARLGAGRPAKPLEDKVLEGTATLAERRAYAEGLPAVPGQAPPRSRRLGSVTRPAPVSRGSVRRPEGLSPAQKQEWEAYAPHAIAAHTLTPASAGAFRTLIEIMVERKKLWQKLVRAGWELVIRRPSKKGLKPTVVRMPHPLVKVHQQLLSAETMGLYRFKLTAAAKEMDFVEPPKEDGPIDPFAKFDSDADGAAPSEPVTDDDDAAATERPH